MEGGLVIAAGLYLDIPGNGVCRVCPGSEERAIGVGRTSFIAPEATPSRALADRSPGIPDIRRETAARPDPRAKLLPETSLPLPKAALPPAATSFANLLSGRGLPQDRTAFHGHPACTFRCVRLSARCCVQRLGGLATHGLYSEATAPD